MLEDSELEAVAETAKSAYMDSTNMSEFCQIMAEFHFNTPPYIFRTMFIAIAEFDKG